MPVGWVVIKKKHRIISSGVSGNPEAGFKEEGGRGYHRGGTEAESSVIQREANDWIFRVVGMGV